MRVRLLGWETQKILYTENGYNLFHRDKSEAGKNDEWWYIQPNGDNTTYLIKHDATGNFLAFDPDYSWVQRNADSRCNFKFQQGIGGRIRYFRITNPGNNGVLFSRSRSPQVSTWRANENPYDDQYFSFIFEDMEVKRIEYKFQGGILGAAQPESIATGRSSNTTNQQQTNTVTLRKTIEEESNFTSELAFMVTAGVEFTAGVPEVASSKISMSFSTSTRFQWGKSRKTITEWSNSVPITMDPNSSYKVTATASVSTMDVPFIAYLQSPTTFFETTIEGIYKGVVHYNFDTTYEKV